MTAISEQRPVVLQGRAKECHALHEVLSSIRSGRSDVVVVCGEAGIGKSALLGHLQEAATDCTVLTAAGVESDMELTFAGLQQLCAPVLDMRSCLPAPQLQALECAFGLGESDGAPDRFLVGLAVLGLLAAAAQDRPLLCLVDDVQWLDQVSAQTLMFVARRLQAESVGLVLAMRSMIEGTAGLPTIEVAGLAADPARAVLDSVFPAGLDDAVRDRIVAESGGNPLALLEMPNHVDAVVPTGAGRRAELGSVPAGIEERYRAVMATLPPETQLLLVVAAAEPVGDPTSLAAAMAHLGLKPSAMLPALESGLLRQDARVQFRHPLARSAAYRRAGVEQRREAHAALAAVTDPALDPDRRAWHRGLAAEAADEDVAQELAGSAWRARQRGGIAAAAAFLTRSVELTPDAAARGERALAAAEAHREVAAFDEARGLLATAELGPLSPLQEVRLAQLRTRLAFTAARVGGDVRALIDAVERFATVAAAFEPLDGGLAVETYLEAMSAAMYVGRSGGGLARDVAERARLALRRHPPRDALALATAAIAERLTAGAVAAMPAMRTALAAITRSATETGGAAAADWFWRAFPIVHDSLVHETWDDGWALIAAHALRVATETGAMALLPSALLSRAGAHVERGELACARALVADAGAMSEAIDYAPMRYHTIIVAAFGGDEAEVARFAAHAVQTGAQRGEGRTIGLAHYATAVIDNAMGRYPEALAAAREAMTYDDLGFGPEVLVESIEAAVRADDREFAVEALARLERWTSASGSPRALGALARSRALLSDGDRADALYLEAIEHFSATSQRVQLARVRLLHGEWLRRNAAGTAAREPLRVAHEQFVAMGAAAFAERARRELVASGQKARRQPTAVGDQLSPQEHQIAQLAGQGLTNQEIAGQMFLSAHTVEWHLRKVFAKLGIRSRRELRRTFADAAG